ncbi:MAG: hypothetical protein M5U22_21355 [Thermoleophilia bacterium]|nr:hypothetical protein [Thermoleophilia bacterium]
MDRDVNGKRNDGAVPTEITAPDLQTVEGTAPTWTRAPGGRGGGHGAMGHGGMGHVLHMAPMLLILFAPRLGLVWTLVLAAAFAGFMIWRSMRRRSAKTGSHFPDAPEDAPQ